MFHIVIFLYKIGIRCHEILYFIIVLKYYIQHFGQVGQVNIVSIYQTGHRMFQNNLILYKIDHNISQSIQFIIRHSSSHSVKSVK